MPWRPPRLWAKGRLREQLQDSPFWTNRTRADPAWPSRSDVHSARGAVARFLRAAEHRERHQSGRRLVDRRAWTVAGGADWRHRYFRRFGFESHQRANRVDRQSVARDWIGPRRKPAGRRGEWGRRDDLRRPSAHHDARLDDIRAGVHVARSAGRGRKRPRPSDNVGEGEVGGFPAAFFWCVAVSLIASVLLYKSRFGLRVFSIGASSENAELNGVDVITPRVVCYVLCSVSSAVAGIYLTGRISTGDPTMGQPFSLDSVTAIALGGVQLAGGVGSVIGAVLGTVTLGLIANGMNLLGVSPFLRAALTGVLLLGAISLQRRRTIGV